MRSAQIIFLLLQFVLTVDCHDALLQARFKILRKIGDNITCENIERVADLEYPRRNMAILTRLNGLWQSYYKCLEENGNVERKPEIRRLQLGQYAELQCKICARPFQNYEELEWKYKRLSPNGQTSHSLRNLILTPEMVLTPNKTLKIYNAVESLGGLYVCYRKDSVISVYILEVSKNDTLEQKPTESRRKKIIRIKRKVLLVRYTWSEWTECNACGRVGKKFKYGACYVTFKKARGNFEKKVVVRNAWKISNEGRDPTLIARYRAIKRKFLKNLKAQNRASEKFKGGVLGLEIIQKFSTGIPCASNYLPKRVSHRTRKYKAARVVVRRCWEPCEKSEIFMAMDSKGHVIEYANNSAGIYSMFQEFPQLPPEVERRTISADFGHSLLIHCPGTSLTDTPPVWKIQNKILLPDVIANDSKGRITIDLLNRIYIKRLRLADSHTYSCWHKKQLVGTVRLIVEKKFSFRLNHHVILILMLFSLVSLLVVGKKLITRELVRQKK